MKTRFKHSPLGQYRGLDIGTAVTMISDRELKELLAYLNASKKSKSERIVFAILEEMLEVEKIQAPLFGETKEELQIIETWDGSSDPDPRFAKIAPDKYRVTKDIQTREFSINRALASHRFYPTVHHATRGYWKLTWRVRSRSKQITHPPDAIPKITDSFALQRIMDFARTGQLNRFRRCLQCQKWLYANFKHQNYCSAKCQQKHYAQSPEWKVKRRDYMRGYRRRVTSKPPRR